VLAVPPGHGGAPIATETLRRARAAFPGATLLHSYGATETSPIATLLPEEEQLLDAPQARSCGRPAVGVEVAIRDRLGERVATGKVGELVIRGDNVMAGCWSSPSRPPPRSSTAGTAAATSATRTSRCRSRRRARCSSASCARHIGRGTRRPSPARSASRQLQPARAGGGARGLRAHRRAVLAGAAGDEEGVGYVR
jgi:acyl-CoA synthetase (AMP-forming)/AMP-acid ligase II